MSKLATKSLPRSLVDKISEPVRYFAPIRDWPESERPREKAIRSGCHTLGDAELLGLCLGSGTGGLTAVDLARAILLRYGDLEGLAAVNLQELLRIRGVGPAKAVRLMAVIELARRLASTPRDTRIQINTPEAVWSMFSPGLRDLKREVFKLLLLDSGNQVIRDVTISEGTLNASLVHPREVFKTAIDYLAGGIILMHNHPSGHVRPSTEDKRITKQLIEAGNLLGIPVLDHIIIGKNGYFSFVEENLI